MSKTKDSEELGKGEVCFIIMPIADFDGYNVGHFKRVYEDIFKPACIMAGFTPVRSDDVFKTNFIQLDILQKLLDSPMAICDLSSRNPNVLYELGMRQAFDKPTLLVQEFNTPKIFDINILRYTEYNNSLDYQEVLKAQTAICQALLETESASKNKDSVNSLVKLLGLQRAEMKNVEDSSIPELSKVFLSDMNAIKRDLAGYVSAITNQQSQSIITDNAIYKLDSFDKGIVQLEKAITAGVSTTILRGMYNDLQNEYHNLNFLIPFNGFQRDLFMGMFAKLSSLMPKINFLM